MPPQVFTSWPNNDYPLYAFVRRSGHALPDTQDLTQEFFYRLMDKRWSEVADREKGRLRSKTSCARSCDAAPPSAGAAVT